MLKLVFDLIKKQDDREDDGVVKIDIERSEIPTRKSIETDDDLTVLDKEQYQLCAIKKKITIIKHLMTPHFLLHPFKKYNKREYAKVRFYNLYKKKDNLFKIALL